MQERYRCNVCQIPKKELDFSEHARAQAKAGDENAACWECLDRLYRHRLGREELEAYLAEDTDKRLDKFRLAGQEERKNKDARWGRALHHSEFIAKLKSILPTAHMREGTIVWDYSGTMVKDLSLYDIKNGDVRYLGYIHEGWSPEYSIIHANSQNLPVREQRGWRTILLRLIKGGYITEQQALQEFGNPSNGEQAKFYRAELFAHRHQRGI